jgi:ABC-type arginine transport system permease subunit
MVAFGLGFLVFGRSETVRGLSGPGRDERWAMIDIHATALAGMVLICVVIGAFLVEVARGEDGSPYGQLGAIAGIAYIIAVAVMRARS